MYAPLIKRKFGMNKKDKIQYLIISHLMEYGSIKLNLPDNMQVEIGITQEGKHGRHIENNYCWIEASRDNKSVEIDSFNLGLNFRNNDGIVLINDVEDDVSVSVI